MAKDQIKSSCKAKLIDIIKAIQMENKYKADYILVLDEITVKIVSSLFQMNQMLNIRITLLQTLKLQRRPFEQLNSIYYIRQTSENIDRLFKDFEDKDEPKYFSINLLFADEVSEQNMKKIGQNENIIKRVATFQQFNLSLIFFLNHVISFQSQFPLTLLKQANQINKLCDNLLFALDAFHENNYEIIYQNHDQCQLIANKLADSLKKLKKQKQEQGIITIVIVDRLFDPVSPLVRGFCYQPMLLDLMQAQSNIIQLKDQKIILNNKDSIYMKYRNKHISIASSEIMNDYNLYKKNNEASKFRNGQHENLETIISHIPEYKETIQNFTNNINIMHMLLDLHTNKKLNKLGQIELTLISGLNSDGSEETQKNIQKICISYLDKIEQLDKCRLIILMLMCLQLAQKDRQSLQKEILSKSQKYKNISSAIKKICPKKFRLKEKKKSKQQQSFILNRHQPKLYDLMTSVVNKKVYQGFKSAKITNTTNETKQKRLKIGQKKQETPKEKIIVYVRGGIGHNQITLIEKLEANRQIYFIGEKIYTPIKYLNELATLS